MIPEKIEYCPGCGASSGGNWNYYSQCCGDCGYDRINPVASSMDSMRWTIGSQRQRIAELEQRLEVAEQKLKEAEEEKQIGWEQLSALRAEREWVPVSERLPEFDVPVLAIPEGYPHQITTAMRTDGGDGWLWAQLCHGYCATLNEPGDYEFDDDYQYTHWMPLPTPPDTEREEQR